MAKVVLTNCLGFTQMLESGDEMGRVFPMDVVEAKKRSQGSVLRVGADEWNTLCLAEEEKKQRKEKLCKLFNPELKGVSGGEQLCAMLEEYHDVFSLGKEDRGETDLY